MKDTIRVIRTDKQVYDVSIKTDDQFIYITVSVGRQNETSIWGQQDLILKIKHDANLSMILRDWEDIMRLLPDAIMEHNL